MNSDPKGVVDDAASMEPVDAAEAERRSKFGAATDGWDATLRVEADLGAVTLRSITGHRWQDRAFDIDSDATPARQVDYMPPRCEARESGDSGVGLRVSSTRPRADPAGSLT